MDGLDDYITGVDDHYNEYIDYDPEAYYDYAERRAEEKHDTQIEAQMDEMARRMGWEI